MIVVEADSSLVLPLTQVAVSVTTSLLVPVIVKVTSPFSKVTLAALNFALE